MLPASWSFFCRLKISCFLTSSISADWLSNHFAFGLIFYLIIYIITRRCSSSNIFKISSVIYFVNFWYFSSLCYYLLLGLFLCHTAPSSWYWIVIRWNVNSRNVFRTSMLDLYCNKESTSLFLIRLVSTSWWKICL